MNTQGRHYRDPGDPTVPPEAKRFSHFCPTGAAVDPVYGSANYTSLNHTQGYAGMVVPLTQFLVDAAMAKGDK